MSDFFGNDKKKVYGLLNVIFISIIFFLVVSNSDTFELLYKVTKPLIIAFVLAYILEPLVQWMNRRLKIKRPLAVLIILIFILMIVFLLIAILVPTLINSVSDILTNFPSSDEFSSWMLNLLNTFRIDDIDGAIETINTILDDIAIKIYESSDVLLQGLVSTTLNTGKIFFSSFLSLVIAMYMLLDKNDLVARWKRLLYAFGRKERVEYTFEVGKKTNVIFKNFFIGKIIDSTIVGIICFVILFVFNFKYASLIAVIIGITNMIPYFGPFIGAVPAILITLIVSPISAFWLGIIIIALQQFDGLILGPKILGDKIGVSAFWIIVAVSVGGSLLGVLGMLVGVPLIVLVKTVIEQTVEHQLKLKGMENFQKEFMK